MIPPGGGDADGTAAAEPPGGGELRRLVPPPRRRPGPFAIAVRWRVELALLGAVGLCGYLAGPRALGWAAIGAVLLTALLAPLRRGLLGLAQATVAAHRVRVGLVQAGVAGRTGRLPWIVTARPRGDAVLVGLWLPAGTTVDDLRGATRVLATACGAAAVEVVQRSPRHDRAVLVVARPRWGWPTR